MFKEKIKDYGLDLFSPNLSTDLQGFLFICIICLITLLMIVRRPETRSILLTALIMRILFIIIGHYFFHLPDSKADALGYEWSAWNMGKDGFVNAITNFTGPGSQFYAWLMAIPYSIFGRNILILQSIGMFFGIATVYVAYSLSDKIWGKETAIRVGWLVALFPSSILYSVIILKEVYSTFFLLLAMVGTVKWLDQKKQIYAFLALISFVIAGFFHGPLFLGGLIFIFIFFIDLIKNFLNLLLKLKINLINIIYIFSAIFLFFAFFSNHIYLPYIGTFESSIDINRLSDNIANRTRGDASYPEWLIVETYTELIYKSLFRVLYLLFNPFPWSIKETVHLIGVFDGIFYMILFCLIISNLKTLYRNPLSRIILIFLFFYLLIYGIGVSNFGAAIRHRSKFIIEMIILAAPFIPKIIFVRKIRK